MRYRIQGKTGLTVSEVGFGAIPIIRLSQDEAVLVLRRALEKGITFFDTAHLYVDSEDKIGLALSGVRPQVVLASKTMKRDREGARADLELSLRRLRTDYLDLYQLHQVSQEADFETITGPNGALDTITRAREAGHIRHLGVTSHSLEYGRQAGQNRSLQHGSVSLQLRRRGRRRHPPPPGPGAKRWGLWP